MNKVEDMKIFLPKNMRFDCVMCGECCRRWEIAVDPNTFGNLRESDYLKKIRDKYPDHFFMRFDPGRNCAFMETINKRCIMLDDDLCRIHRDLGGDAKPRGCHKFPFELVVTPAGVYVGASFFCPSIQNKKGRAFEDYIPFIRKLLKGLKREHPLGETVDITAGLSTDWEGFMAIEDYVYAAIKDTDPVCGTFRAFAAASTLALLEIKGGSEKVGSDEIKGFFENPVPAPIEREDDYGFFQGQIAATLISMFESLDPSVGISNNNVILSGGTFNSNSFGNVKIKPFDAWINSKLQPCRNSVFREYLEHFIWRKNLLKTNTVLAGLAILHFLPLLYNWYVYAFAAADKREEPEQKDYLSALGVLDESIHHEQNMEEFFESFSVNFMKQIESIIEEEIED